jgi:outer membrane protein OmpA-like peptidoglycan-associated protein
LWGSFSSFSVDTGHTDGLPAVSGYSAIEPARFEISFHRGKLRLDGHTVSSSHEQELLQAVDDSFSAPEASTRFMPFGVAPDQWATTTVSLLEALSATQSSSALLTNGTLRIRGVGAHDWHGRLQILLGELPESIDVDVDIVIPDTKTSAADLCKRAFATRAPGPVNFEESGTALRSSAYLELNRVIALANACRDSSVSITGHTDSSGNEASNRRLSLARAKAVADYFAERGIARERLIAAGAGSSQPVADNGTRFGRSLNRRIDISLQHRSDLEET